MLFSKKTCHNAGESKRGWEFPKILKSKGNFWFLALGMPFDIKFENLVINDETLSKQKRAELLQNFDRDEHFIADLIIFSLERRFEKCKI